MKKLLMIAMLAFSAAAHAQVTSERLGSISRNANVVTSVNLAPIENALNRIMLNISGSNVWFSVTNYMHTTANVPTLSLMENRDGTERLVWSQRELDDATRAWTTNNIDIVKQEMIAAMPSTAWGLYDSATGNVNPDPSCVWMNNGKLVIASGLKYTTLINGSGMYFLTSNEPVSASHHTNGYFRIASPDSVLMEFRHNEGYTIGANAEDITPTDDNTYQIKYRVNAQPILYTTTELGANTNWQAENVDPKFTVTWSTGSDSKGAYHLATVGVVQAASTPMGFFRATVTVEGSNNLFVSGTVEPEQGIKVGDKIIRPVVNGSTVTWEIVNP